MSNNINVAARKNGHLNGEAGAHFAASAKQAILEPAPGVAINKRARLPKARNPEVVPPPKVSEPERKTEQPAQDNGQPEGISPKSLADEIEAAARMNASKFAEWATDKKKHAEPFGITGTELIKHVKARRREIAAEKKASDKKEQAEQRARKEEEASKSQRRSRPQNPGFTIDWPEITDKGVKGRSQENIEAFLDHAGVTLKFDAMAYRTIVMRAGKAVTLTDEVAKGLWYEADRLGLPSKDTYFFGFLENKAREASFHPIRDYLDSLEWDGVPRVDEWLYAYFDAENTLLNSAYGRKHLIAAVRRVRQPGCKHDAMLVLQGPQGAGKSSSIKALCPDEDYFTDSLSVGADQKEVIEITTGKWLVELPELTGMGKREAGTVKAQLSRQVDGARLSYARAKSERPRQCVFFGTVNDAHYLRDATGNRRFWPVTISGKHDPDKIAANVARDRDQLWAEAAHYEAEDESLILPKELWAIAAEGQQARMIIDPWEELLCEGLHGRKDFIRSDAIYGMLEIPKERRAGATGQRICSILTRLGFKRVQRRPDGVKQVWGYVPCETVE